MTAQPRSNRTPPTAEPSTKRERFLRWRYSLLAGERDRTLARLDRTLDELLMLDPEPER